MAVKILTDKRHLGDDVDGAPVYVELDARERTFLDRSTDSGTWSGEPVFRITWTGCVLDLRERNMYDDNDFYAIVWDDAKSAPRWVEYASTRGWTYANSAAVDATDEAKAKYAAWQRAQDEARHAEREAREAATPYVGKTVKVVKGRKIRKGTVAEVVWFGDDTYNSTMLAPRHRIALMIDGAWVFTSADNVEVVQA